MESKKTFKDIVRAGVATTIGGATAISGAALPAFATSPSQMIDEGMPTKQALYAQSEVKYTPKTPDEALEALNRAKEIAAEATVNKDALEASFNISKAAHEEAQTTHDGNLQAVDDTTQAAKNAFANLLADLESDYQAAVEAQDAARTTLDQAKATQKTYQSRLEEANDQLPGLQDKYDQASQDSVDIQPARDRLDAAQKAYDEAQSLKSSAEIKRNQAWADRSAAQAAYEEASRNLTNANNALSTASINAATAEGTYNDALSSLSMMSEGPQIQEQLSIVENARAAYEAAERNKRDAQARVQECQALYDQAVADKEKAEAAVAEADATLGSIDLSEANKNVSDAESEYNAANSAYDAAFSQNQTLKSEYDNASSQLEQAAATMNQAQQDLEAAERGETGGGTGGEIGGGGNEGSGDIGDGETGGGNEGSGETGGGEISGGGTQYTENDFSLKDFVDEQQVGNASNMFLRTDAYGSPMYDSSMQGQPGDATYIQNVKSALDVLQQIDELRAGLNLGLGQIQVTEELMAYAAVSANWAAQHTGEYPPETYPITEFLSWGSAVNVQDWVYNQKSTYDAAASDPTTYGLQDGWQSLTPADLKSQYPDFFAQAGGYIVLTQQSGYFGAGLNTNNYTMDVCYSTTANDYKSNTVSEWRGRLDQWLQAKVNSNGGYVGEITVGQYTVTYSAASEGESNPGIAPQNDDLIAAAQNALEIATADFLAKKDAFDAASAAYEQSNTALQNADTRRQTAQTVYQSAQSMRDSLNQRYEAATTAKIENQQEANRLAGSLPGIQADKEAAENSIPALDEAVTQALDQYNTANANFSDAVMNIGYAGESFLTKYKAYTAAQTQKADAETLVTSATKAEADALTARQKAEAEATAAEAEYNQRESELGPLKTTLDTVMAEYKQYNDRYQNIIQAEQALQEAKDTIATLTTKLEELSATIATASDEVDACQAELDKKADMMDRAQSGGFTYEAALETPIPDEDFAYLNEFITTQRNAEASVKQSADALVDAKATREAAESAFNDAYDTWVQALADQAEAQAVYDELVAQASGGSDNGDDANQDNTQDGANDNQGSGNQGGSGSQGNPGNQGGGQGVVNPGAGVAPGSIAGAHTAGNTTGTSVAPAVYKPGTTANATDATAEEPAEAAVQPASFVPVEVAENADDGTLNNVALAAGAAVVGIGIVGAGVGIGVRRHRRKIE